MQTNAINELNEKSYTKDELVSFLVEIFINPEINATAAGGIFTFSYGKYVVDKYTPTELIEAAHNINEKIKTRYSAELNGAFLMYRYFKKHPEMFKDTTVYMRQLVAKKKDRE